MDYISAIFSSILPQIPSLILHAIGLGLAVARRKEYPRAALAAGIYFGLVILISLANQIYVILPIYMTQQGGTATDISGLYTTLTYICIPFRVVMDIALLYAIFAPRNPSQDSNSPIFIGGQNG